MDSREQDLALLESAALRLEAIEQSAEKRFDEVYDLAERSGRVEHVTSTPEFQEWMAARRETDAAWGQWAASMQGD